MMIDLEPQDLDGSIDVLKVQIEGVLCIDLFWPWRFPPRNLPTKLLVQPQSRKQKLQSNNKKFTPFDSECFGGLNDVCKRCICKLGVYCIPENDSALIYLKSSIAKPNCIEVGNLKLANIITTDDNKPYLRQISYPQDRDATIDVLILKIEGMLCILIFPLYGANIALAKYLQKIWSKMQNHESHKRAQKIRLRETSELRGLDYVVFNYFIFGLEGTLAMFTILALIILFAIYSIHVRCFFGGEKLPRCTVPPRIARGNMQAAAACRDTLSTVILVQYS